MAQCLAAADSHLYQGRYKCFPVATEDYFYQVVRYVERKALRANPWSERNRGVGRVCAVWSAKTRRSPSSRRGLCLAPPTGSNLSTSRKRKPKWRRCVAGSIAVGPSAIPTGSQTRPSDWGWNGRFGLVEDRRNNHKAFHGYLYSPDLVAVTFSERASERGACHLQRSERASGEPVTFSGASERAHRRN